MPTIAMKPTFDPETGILIPKITFTVRNYLLKKGKPYKFFRMKDRQMIKVLADSAPPRRKIAGFHWNLAKTRWIIIHVRWEFTQKVVVFRGRLT